MRFFLLVIVVFLIIGCDYFDDGGIEPVIYDSTPVILPPDAEWELIGTLERNPLSPSTFYVFDWQAEAMNLAYQSGKHFIFEIGVDYRERSGNKILHYIIQPAPPFQESSAERWDYHRYTFLSEGWYVPRAEGSFGEAIGLGVEFNDFEIHSDAGQRFGDNKIMKIGLVHDLKVSSIGLGSSYINADARLRFYVSK